MKSDFNYKIYDFGADFVIMEKAVYSLSDITRDDYELFYMCIQSINQLSKVAL